MKNEHTVRAACSADLPFLAEIEKWRWGREGTEIMDLKTLRGWYEEGSPFFLVAEKDGKVSGFYYAIQVDFSLQDIEAHTSQEAQTHHGRSIHTHDPRAESVYAVNIVVTSAGAGAALNAAVHQKIRELKMLYFIGVPRLVHLDQYLRSVESMHNGTLPYPQDDIALWYAHESMKLMPTNRTWEECTPEPNLCLPPLRRPDMLLKFTVQNIHAGLLRIIPNFMKDPKSRDYGAFLAAEITRR